MHQISLTQEDVVRRWLGWEAAKPWQTIEPPAEDADHEDALRALHSYQSSFLDEYDLNWRATTLDEATFRTLRVIPGPAEESWRLLSPDGTIAGAADRIRREEVQGFFEDVSVDQIRHLATQPWEAEAARSLVVVDAPDHPGPFVVDGNHHATARALHLLTTGEYVPQRALVGRAR